LSVLANRTIEAIGPDTSSLDYGQSTQFESHRILYGANIPAFENVTSRERLPLTGGFAIALPMQVGGGIGAPLRAMAFVPSHRLDRYGHAH
jgi:kynurenine formamidase